jgi:D-alanyl-D-alanine carboxypeptidase
VRRDERARRIGELRALEGELERSRRSQLGRFEPYVERFEKNGQVFFRARFAGFGGRNDATAMCNELKKAKMSCLAMQS